MSSLRCIAVAVTLMLAGAVAPAHAGLDWNAITSNALSPNALSPNALSPNALSPNALATTGSLIADLNGVVIEAILLPPGTRP
jgi:hypothetical protein